MPRIARVVGTGLPYHVTQRGNYGQPVFDDAEDREKYLGWLRFYSRSSGLSIWAYCLMTNHVHFVAVPAEGKENALARTFNQLHMRYAQYLNGRRKRRGHLWQGRFYSCPLDDAHLYEAVKYVERNPVRARMVASPTDYEWSSARAHSGLCVDPLLEPGRPFPACEPDWPAFRGRGLTPGELDALAHQYADWAPDGPDGFISDLDMRLGRSRRISPGRRLLSHILEGMLAR